MNKLERKGSSNGSLILPDQVKLLPKRLLPKPQPDIRHITLGNNIASRTSKLEVRAQPVSFDLHLPS